MRISFRMLRPPLLTSITYTEAVLSIKELMYDDRASALSYFIAS